MPTQTLDPGGSVAAGMNRLPVTRLHRRIIVVVGLGLFFDMFEIFLAGTMSTVLKERFHLSAAQLPLVLGSTFLGMFIGALVLGRLADRMGRRRAFLFNLCFYSFFTLLGAFSPNPVFLVATRFCAGLGVGAEHPLADAYLSDVLPARHRGRCSAWAYTFSYLAVPVVGFAALGLSTRAPWGVDGWRWLMASGALGAVLVLWLRRNLPESPRWLESAGRQAEAEAVMARFEREAGPGLPPPAAAPAPPAAAKLPLKTLLRAPYKRRLTMLGLFHLLQTWGYYGFGTLVPTVLVARGYSVTNSLLFSSVTFIGYPCGSLLSLPLIKRFERKYLLVGTSVGMALLGLGFGLSDSSAGIIGFGLCFTLTSNVFSNAYHIYQAEIFPTALRATAASWTYALSRLSSGAMPLLLVPVLRSAGASVLFAMVATAMIIVALDVLLLGPRTAGRSLEELNPIPSGSTVSSEGNSAPCASTDSTTSS
ncbi:MFS transporter [Streptomyces sp. NPDC050161]|uniref:MFS transporter n=1 Tax=Streptomyces sp. NPDC050161 TaxID=3365604 RepID=UPI0037A3839D